MISFLKKVLIIISKNKRDSCTVIELDMASARAGFALITPASRGIGFALARQLLVHTDLPVCATARKDCDTVHDKLVKSINSKRDAAKRLTVLEADVTSKLALNKIIPTFLSMNWYNSHNLLSINYTYVELQR